MYESSLIFEQSVIIFCPLLASSAVLVWGSPGGGQTSLSCAISHHMGELLHQVIGQIDRLQSRLRS